MVIYFKKALYREIQKYCMAEEITIHQLAVRAIMEHIEFNCRHNIDPGLFVSTEVPHFFKFREMGSEVCRECGLVR